MLAKDGDPGAEVLVAECAGGLALPVFSGEGEAEMFLWRRRIRSVRTA